MSDVFLEKDSSILQLEKWEQLNPLLRAGFTTRKGGLSEQPYDTFNFGLHVPDTYETVILNRERLSKKLLMPIDTWVCGEQTHETNIRIINNQDKGRGAISYESSLKRVDGLITNKPGVLCTAFFADCVPLYFFDPISNYIGIAHAGWKGTVNNIAGQMIKKLMSVGVNLENLLVAIGPCISQKQYEVDAFVLNHIDEEYKESVVKYKDTDRFLLDLKQLNVEMLLKSGVLRDNIDVTNYCTFTNIDQFFSHRRDDGKTGRMLGYIGYRERNN